MSWLSNFLGIKKVRTPKVQPAQEIEFAEEDEYSIEAYLRRLAKKSGFEKTIITGGKMPKLGASSYLGAK